MNEPLFHAIDADDPEFRAAHARAAATIAEFVARVRREDGATKMAKLRFRDPETSERLGEDRFLYLWLAQIVHHPEQRMLSGVFFEVPEELLQWHQVGQRLGFDPEDVFDWMVIRDGHLHGGFTVRVTRARQQTAEARARYDAYIGVSSYEPIADEPG